MTCSESLLHPGVCCELDCTETAKWALLGHDFIEHAVCPDHVVFPRLATKPLVWSPAWGETG